jgi:hypothetical protein
VAHHSTAIVLARVVMEQVVSWWWLVGDRVKTFLNKTF